MNPDEILDPLFEDINFAEVRASADRAGVQVREFVDTANIPTAGYVALPAFVLGFVGGAVGAKMLKGTVGVALGVGAAWWAYNKLNEGPKTLAPGQNVSGKVSIAQPPKKLGDYGNGC